MKIKSLLFKSLLGIILIFSSIAVFAQNEFITHWKMSSNEIRINVNGSFGTHNYNLKWKVKGTSTFIGDLTNLSSTRTINIPNHIGDTIEVHISGTFYAFTVLDLDSDKSEIINVAQWGNLPLKSTQQMFKNCPNLKVSATDAPNLSQVQFMNEMFNGCSLLNSNFNHWNVSNVKSMNSLFMGCSSYNQPLNNWQVNAVTDMNSMFRGCFVFNQPLNSWIVSSVTDMSSMFQQARNFNQPLNSWNVSRVTSMKEMFASTEAFNQNIQSWNLAACTTLSAMFKTAHAYNSPIENLNVTNVTDFSQMFSESKAFNQPLNGWTFANANVNLNQFLAYNKVFNQTLEGWNLAGVTNLNDVFFSCYIPYCTLDQTLIAWSQQATLPSGVQFGEPLSVASQTARQLLINTKSWSFSSNPLIDVAANPITITFPNGLCGSSTNTIIQANNSTAYEWSNGVKWHNIPPPNLTPGTYTISVSDRCGNTAGPVSYTISNDVANVSLGPDLMICDNQNSTTVTLTATGATEYRWPGSSEFTTTNTYNLTVNLFDNRQIIVEGKSGSGCIGRDTILVKKQQETLFQYMTPTSAVCSGTPAYFSGSTATSYTWKIYDSNNQLVETLTGSPATYNPTVTSNSSANYTGVMDVVLTNGCPITRNFSFTISPTPQLTVDYIANCTNPARRYYDINVSGADEYKWDVLSGSSQYETTTNKSYSINFGGSYNYIIEGRNAAGCVDVDTIKILPTSYPNYSLLGLRGQECSGTVLDIYATNSINTTFTVSDQNNQQVETYTGSNFIYTVPSVPAGTSSVNYTFDVSMEFSNGCIVDRREVMAVSQANASISVLSANCVDTNQRFLTLSASGGDMYNWTGMTGWETVNTNSYNLLYTEADTIVLIARTYVGCSDTIEYIIPATTRPVYDITVPTAIACGGTSIQLAGTGADNYEWLIFNSNNQISDQTTGANASLTVPSVTGSSILNFQGLVRVSFNNGCLFEDEFTIRAKDCELSITDFDANTISVYPNPASSIITIHSDQNHSVQVYDMTGKNVMNTTVTKTQNTIDITTLTDGIYMLQLDKNPNARVKIQIAK